MRTQTTALALATPLLRSALLGTALFNTAAQAATGYALAVSAVTGQTVAVLTAGPAVTAPAVTGSAVKTPAVTTPTVSPPATAIQGVASAERRVFARLNQIRAASLNCPGSGPRPAVAALRPSSLHAASAFRQASYMARSGEVSHIGAGGTTPRVRAVSSGIQTVSVTEIIYLGSRLDPETAVQWWLHSPLHCSIVTDGGYTTAGVSVVRGERGTAYVVVLTSSPR